MEKKSIKKSSKKIEEKILEISIELARKGEGALFVIGEKVNYSLLIKQKIGLFNLFETGSSKILKSIATIDGAVIINSEGDVVAYGAMIKKAKPFLGYGTRHAAALTASQGGNISIMCSEEERKVKIFKDGKFVLQVDALQKNIKKQIPTMAAMLESLGVGFLGVVGATALAPQIGIAIVPGIIVFGASYYAITKIVDFLKDRI